MVRVKGNKINGVEFVALEGMTKEGHECAQKIKEKDQPEQRAQIGEVFQFVDNENSFFF